MDSSTNYLYGLPSIADGVLKKWEASGLKLADLVHGLPDEDMKKIEAALGVSGQETASPAPGAGLGLKLQDLCKNFQAALDKSTSAESLEQALKDVIHQAGSEQRKLAVRAFTTVMLNIGLELKENPMTHQKEYMLNTGLMDSKLPCGEKVGTMPSPIRDLFDDETSIQALYALQVVMQEKEHPKEATSNFINWLYDSDLVSEDVLKAWGTTDRRKHEQIGYHMTVQNADGFLKWLDRE